MFYRSPYTLAGLGASGFTCSSTVCKGSKDPSSTTDPSKTRFGPMQLAVNQLLATYPQLPVALLVTDGKIGSATVGALRAVGTSAGQYPIALPNLKSYGTKAPSISTVATNAAAITAELQSFARYREREQGVTSEDAAQAQATAAIAAAEDAAEKVDALTIIYGAGSSQVQAAVQAAAAAQSNAAVATQLAVQSSRAWGFMPLLSGKASTDRAIYGIGALALLYFGYKKYKANHAA